MSVDISVRDRIATIVLNRPEARNAIDHEMRRAVREAWQRIASDGDIDVAIVIGAGDQAFSAGADLKGDSAVERSFASLAFGDGINESLTAGIEMDKPLICAFNGHARGGGLEIGLACDIRIASGNATFALPEVRVGTIPGSGGTQRLPRLVGASDAMLMLLTGDAIDASEALRIGLVSRVVPIGELAAAAHSIAARIVSNAPLAVRAVKRLATRYRDAPLEQALLAERNAWGLLRDTEDRAEGRAAFAQKRPPKFKGR